MHLVIDYNNSPLTILWIYTR